MLTIAGLQLSRPLILAPLAGYTDLPFRQLCREFGAGLGVSEMISCHALVYGQKKTLQMLASDPAEKPVSFQLFGADVHMMAKAADLLNSCRPDLVDINMGCPVKKVTRKGAGAALMATPRLAEEILRAVVSNSEAPVTVKIRKGVDANSESCVDFARMAEDCGAAAVTVHGRTWSQGFTGTADWHCVGRVKRAVSLPVIGNGDIKSHAEALLRMADSGCDGVMIGRAALGNPWVFSESGRPAEAAVLLRTVIRHLDLMQRHLEVDRLLGLVKNHIGRYFKYLPNSSVMRKRVYASTSYAQLRTAVEELAHDSRFPQD